MRIPILRRLPKTATEPFLLRLGTSVAVIGFSPLSQIKQQIGGRRGEAQLSHHADDLSAM